MNYQEFLTNIQTHFSQCMEENTTLEIRKITKNNGTSYDGLIILRPNSNISPTIYLTPYYQRYLEGVSMEDIYLDIQKTYEKNLPKDNFDTSDFTDYSKSKDKIVMRLVNYEKNKELLTMVPHRRYLDFAIIFYCLLYADKQNQASILIYRQHLEFWGIDEDELYFVATQNTPSLLPYICENIMELLKIENIAPNNMYILSNSYRTNGASVILYDGLLQKIADQFQSDFVLLPSSVHEVILIPLEKDVNYSDLSAMVTEINETQVLDCEVLSNHVYVFSRKDGILIQKK